VREMILKGVRREGNGGGKEKRSYKRKTKG
jgi:hypothetical protein